MDTNKIKKFATEARNILKAGIAARLTALGFDHKGQVPENNLKCATKPFNVLLACTHPLITDNVESNCSTTRNYSSENSEFLRFNMYFCHVYLKKIVMKQIIKRGSFFTLMFMLLGCLSLYAADNDLITKQITIQLEKAGTLPDRIASSKKYKITNLKIIGEINGTDLNMIREMAGSDYTGSSTDGKLSVLDLYEAKIVEGGDCYYYGNNSNYYYTSNDEIGDCAFYGCSGLTSLTLPAGITEIGYEAFNGCSGLTSLTLPAGITEIGSFAFEGCSGLTSLTLPASITKIGSEAFYECSGLTSLTLPAGITEIGDGAFSGCSGLTSLTLPAGITEIGDYAFQGCSGLTSLTLPAGITSIGDSAFLHCSGLTSLTLPAGITEIGDDAFRGCSGLTSLTLPAGITEIGSFAFEGCSGLTSLTLPASITKIGSEAFYECSGLTSLTLPAGITEIGDGAFSGCSGLTSLTLPAGITEIGSEAFEGCSGLTSIYVYAEKVPKIGSNVFVGVDAKKCTLYVPMGTHDDYWVSDFGDYFENIVEFDATGIDKTTTSTDVEEVARYSVNGQRLSAPTKGLNIVKYSDGSVKKVAER